MEERDKDDSRPPAYLKTEYLQLLERGVVRYMLQVQVNEDTPEAWATQTVRHHG